MNNSPTKFLYDRYWMTRGDVLGKYNLVVMHIKLWKSLSQRSR